MCLPNHTIQVYITAISGHIPDEMVQCLSAFMNCCYIAHYNTITTSHIALFQHHLADFHWLQLIFVTTGVRKDISLPWQHTLMHYPKAIEWFGSPNSTCTSQTKAKHKKAVKEPWCWSNHNKPLLQMVQTITCLDKLMALQQVFRGQGMLVGTISNYMAQSFCYATSFFPSLYSHCHMWRHTFLI